MTAQISMGDLIKHTVAKLFEWSGTKLLDMSQWEQQLTDLVAHTEEDTLHRTGFLAEIMTELYHSDALHEAKAVQKLAGALWFTHSKLLESLESRVNEIDSVNAELNEIEVDRDRIRGMLEIKLTEISELNLELTNTKEIINSERAEHEKELLTEKGNGSDAALKATALNTRINELAEKVKQYASAEETWEATENRLRAKIHDATTLKNRGAIKIKELQEELEGLQKENTGKQSQIDRKEEIITQLKQFKSAHSGCTQDMQNATEIEELNDTIVRLKEKLEEITEYAGREKQALEAANKTFSERLLQTRSSHRLMEEKLQRALEAQDEQERTYIEAQADLVSAKKEAALVVQKFESQKMAIGELNKKIHELSNKRARKPQRRTSQGGDSESEHSESNKENRAPRSRHTVRYSELPDAQPNDQGVDRQRATTNGKWPTVRDPIPESARIHKRTLDREQEIVDLRDLNREQLRGLNHALLQAGQTNNVSRDEARSRGTQPVRSGTGSDTENEDRRGEALQLLRVRKQLSAINPTGQNSSHGDTEPSWGLLQEMRKRKAKSDTRLGDEIKRDRRDEFPKSVKTINQMISKFRKGGTVNILEHIILYERLMKTLGMTANEELIRYLPWTFEDKLQAFFLEIDNDNYPEWCGFRAEVIKNFSTHRNKHEALLHALALKCQPNQNPREFFHELKKAFAQVYTVVDTESDEFRRTLFHGMPESTKAHMAGSYNDRKSSQWILEQAKSIYDVSRTVETDRNYKKNYQQDKKVSEISSQKEQLPFESGKPNRQADDKSSHQRQEQKPRNPPQQDGGSYPRRDPGDLGIGGDLGVDYYVSRNYTGSRPIKNYKYKGGERNSQSSGDERRRANQQGGRQSPQNQPQRENRSDYEQRQEQMPYQQAQQQSENRNNYSESDRRQGNYQKQNHQQGQGGQRYVRYSEKNDERMAKVEQTLDHLAKVLFNNQMANQAQQRQAAQATAEAQN